MFKRADKKFKKIGFIKTYENSDEVYYKREYIQRFFEYICIFPSYVCPGTIVACGYTYGTSLPIGVRTISGKERSAIMRKIKEKGWPTKDVVFN